MRAISQENTCKVSKFQMTVSVYNISMLSHITVATPIQKDRREAVDFNKN